MFEEINKSVNSEQCLSEALMLKYIQDRLTLKERHAVEKHLQQCELCSDAMEGLTAMKNPESIQSIVSELNEEIDRTIEKRKTNIFLWSGIAASLLLFAFGIIFLIEKMNNTSQEISVLAVKVERITEIPEPPVITLPQSESNLSSTLAEDAQEEKKTSSKKDGPYLRQAAPEKQETEENNIISEQAANEVREDIHANKVYADEVKPAPSIVQNAPGEDRAFSYEKEEEMTTSKKSRVIPSQADQSIGMPSAPTSKSAPIFTPVQQAKAYFNAREYERTINVLEPVLKENPDAQEALLYSGVSHFFLSEFDKAINQLKKIKKEGAQYEEGRYYLALSYSGNKDEITAKKILNEIISGNGSFREKSEDALGNMK